jgi:hypothetical protein
LCRYASATKHIKSMVNAAAKLRASATAGKATGMMALLKAAGDKEGAAGGGADGDVLAKEGAKVGLALFTTLFCSQNTSG